MRADHLPSGKVVLLYTSQATWRARGVRGSKLAATIAVVASAALMAACGGSAGGSGVTPPPPPVAVASVKVTPGSGSFTIGGTLQLTATDKDASGNTLSGRSNSWASSAPSVATVSSAGLVTGVAAGTAMITATSEGQSGTAAITVAVPVWAIEAVGGNAQAGVMGNALADSLAVKVTDASGAPVSGSTVTWKATGATVSPATSVTDASGMAYTQELLDGAATAASATASAQYAATPAAFSATGRAAVACALTAPASAGSFNEGSTDYTNFLKPIGTLHAVMIFVDFSDAPATGTTDSLYTLLVPHAHAYYSEVSYGHMSLDVTPVKKWFRMSKTSAQYGLVRGTSSVTVGNAGALQKAYMTEAMQLADSAVDFSKYDLVYIVPSDGSAGDYSPAFTPPPGGGIMMDGVEIRHGATFGSDIHLGIPDYGATVLTHETGHTFGLPDLYSFGGEPYPDYLMFAGGWDIMSAEAPHEHYLAWQKLKLGWLDSTQMTCIDGGSLEAVVTPTEVAGGLKALMFKMSASKAYVVEVRQLMGMDAAACDQGVLVYTVDATVATGAGPIRVHPAVTPGTDNNKIYFCGPLYNATYDIGNGKPRVFTDAAAGVTIELVGVSQGSYRIRLRTTK